MNKKIPLIVFTGLDGSGKSTRVVASGLKWLKDEVDINLFNGVRDAIQLYDQYEIVDRFAPLDELVYSKVCKTPTKWYSDDMIKFIRDYSKVRKLDIRIGFTTKEEYERVHNERGEVDYPNYEDSLYYWILYATMISSTFSNNRKIKFTFFHYEKEFDNIGAIISRLVKGEPYDL